MNIFSRFSEDAKLLLSLSYKEAQEMNSSYVGSEHFLLAIIANKFLLDDDTYAGLGLEYSNFKQNLKNISKPDTSFTGVKGYTTRALNAFNRANDATKATNSVINVEEIMFAILEDKDSYAYICAKKLNPEIDSMIDKRRKSRIEETSKDEKKSDSPLKGYGQFLTDAVLENRYENIFIRENETKRIVNILARRFKNNPCLIGDPGVGKTAIVEGLAKYLVSNESVLKQKRIFRLDIASVVSGTKFRGEFEKRFQDILDAIKLSTDTILFIDDLAISMKAGAAEGSIDMSNILKNYMERGEIQLITTAGYDDYKKIIEKDKAFTRRLEIVQINEPSFDETKSILGTVIQVLVGHYAMDIDADVLDAVIPLSKRYLTERFLPDIAIDLLDEAFACKTVEGDKSSLCVDDVRRALSRMTGIPFENLSYANFNNLTDLDSKLRSRVIGQIHAIETITKAIKRGRLGIKDANKPIGSFLFLGNTGVGKTELSKVLAESMFNKDAFIRFDMSEFMEKHSVAKLIGSPPGYVGYEEGGLLTDKVRRSQYSLVLFDEIEKAHPDVYNLLLQILDEGHLMDSRGNKVDFKNTIIIMTSNVGTEQLKKNRAGFTAHSTVADEGETHAIIIESLKKHFRPEFLNRLDEIVIFNTLSNDDILEITKLKLNQFSEKIKKLDINLDYDEQSVSLLAAAGTDKEYGARHLNRTITNLVEDPFADLILALGSDFKNKTLFLDGKDGRVKLSIR